MSRKTDRENVFKLVYDYCLTGERDDNLYESIIEEDKNANENYISSVYNGVIDKYETMVSDISKFSKGFKLDRIYKVDLAILLIAIYEIKYVDDIPQNVAINEAINIAKIYSTEKSGSYINGILKNFVK